MKNHFALGSLALLVAVTGFGCEYYTAGPQEVRYVGEAQPDIATPQPSESEPAGDEAIQPESPVSEGGDTPMPPETGTQSDPQPEAEDENSLCPSGWKSQGTPYLCCRIDDPQVCIIIEPGPGGGGRPGLGDIRPVVEEIKEDSTPPDPTPPPPDSGGGGGGLGGDGIGCHFQGPTGGRRMKNNPGTVNDADEIVSKNDCIML